MISYQFVQLSVIVMYYLFGYQERAEVIAMQGGGQAMDIQRE